MASVLYRIGGWCARRHWTVIIAWAILLAGLFGLAAAVQRPASTSFTIPGTQSQQALDLLNSKFPGTGGASAQVVFSASGPNTVTSAASEAAIETTVGELRRLPQVVGVTDPFTSGTVSANGKVAYTTVAYPVAVSAVTDQAKNALLASGGPARTAGLQVNFGGQLAVPSSTSNTDSIGIVIAFIVLGFTFGSLLAAGLPLVTALVGLGTSLAGILALGAVISLTSTAPVLATMIALAVGIDYALFITTRHRQQLAAGLEVHESIARAIATAGTAVCFAGVTVVIALAALAIAGIPFLTIMGLAAAGAVVIAVAIGMTLVPALLGAIGPRLIRARAARRQIARSQQPGYQSLGHRWVRVVSGHPLIVLIAGAAVLVVLALPIFDMRLGLPDAHSYPTSSTDRRAYDLVTDNFGPGFNGPLLLVVNTREAVKAQEVAQGLQHHARQLPGIEAVSPPVQNPDRTLTLITIIPKMGPNDPATSRLVSDFEKDDAQATRQYGVGVYVTGTTALNLDISTKLSGAIVPYLVIVSLLCALLLLVVFRSILVPVKAVAGYLLSVVATLGAATWIFQEGHLGGLFKLPSTDPIVAFIPVLFLGLLFGLAMDYEVFLVSRIREEYTRTSSPRDSIIDGYSNSARVVAAAALIMIAVFASFMFAPDITIKSLGFTLAFGVLVDALLVRMTLVPATLAITGRAAWWLPRWLYRLLPNIDIEGANLGIAEQAAGKLVDGVIS